MFYYRNEQPINRYMRNGNPIPVLRIEQNNNNIRYQKDSQQNKTASAKPTPVSK